jgi:CBS domain-containing protein
VNVLPVLEEGAVVGIVTASDLVAMVAETDDTPPAEAIMSAPVTTTELSTTLSATAERMQTAGVKHLPVVDSGLYFGVVSADALAPYLSRHNVDVEWQPSPSGSTRPRNGA